MPETIAPFVEVKAPDGTVLKLCWSFNEIRRAEREIKGANITSALLFGDWTMDSTLAAIVGAARTLQPTIEAADVAKLLTSDQTLLGVMAAMMESWRLSRENPSLPANETEPAESASS